MAGDPLYGTRANRGYLTAQGIRFAGKPLGRPKKAQRTTVRSSSGSRPNGAREEYLQRIPIEGKFRQGKNDYRLNYVRAKQADTSSAWINSIFLVMNWLILLRVLFVRLRRGAAGALSAFQAITWQLNVCIHSGNRQPRSTGLNWAPTY